MKDGVPDALKSLPAEWAALMGGRSSHGDPIPLSAYSLLLRNSNRLASRYAPLDGRFGPWCAQLRVYPPARADWPLQPLFPRFEPPAERKGHEVSKVKWIFGGGLYLSKRTRKGRQPSTGNRMGLAAFPCKKQVFEHDSGL